MRVLVHDLRPDSLLATKQLSGATGIPEGTLRYWRSRNEGPPSFVLGRKRVVYRWSEFLEWMGQQEQQSRRGGAA